MKLVTTLTGYGDVQIRAGGLSGGPITILEYIQEKFGKLKNLNYLCSMKLSINYNENGYPRLCIDGEGDTLIVKSMLDLNALYPCEVKNLTIKFQYGTGGISTNNDFYIK